MHNQTVRSFDNRQYIPIWCLDLDNVFENDRDENDEPTPEAVRAKQFIRGATPEQMLAVLRVLGDVSTGYDDTYFEMARDVSETAINAINSIADQPESTGTFDDQPSHFYNITTMTKPLIDNTMQQLLTRRLSPEQYQDIAQQLYGLTDRQAVALDHRIEAILQKHAAELNTLLDDLGDALNLAVPSR